MNNPDLGDSMRLAAALRHLSETIDMRAHEGNTGSSWTARLLVKGPAACAEKVREEGAELATAIARESDVNVIHEAADVLYHALVGLRVRGVTLDAVAKELERRQGMSGIEEKAGR